MTDKFTNWHVQTPNTDGTVVAPPRKPNQPSDEEINAREPDGLPVKPDGVPEQVLIDRVRPSGFSGGVDGVPLKPNQPPMESVVRKGGYDPVEEAANISTAGAQQVGPEHPGEAADDKAYTHGNADVYNAWPDKDEASLNQKYGRQD